MKPRLPAPFVVALLSLATARADVSLPSFFSDHAVLQRDIAVPIWGTADPGENVVVEFAGQTRRTVAASNGRWLVSLDPLPASTESRALSIRGKNTLTFADVLVGEVWLASGQSNMGYSLSGAHNATEAIPKSEDAQLRFFVIKTQTASEPQHDVRGKWELSSPITSPKFSAVAYFFARALRSKLGVPVAVIQSAWGGTPAQAWTSIAALREAPPLTRHIETWEKAVAKKRELDANPQIAADYTETMKRWNSEVRPQFDAAMKAYNAGGQSGPKPVAAWPEPANPDPMGVPSPSARPTTPSVIFNAMIAPLAPYALRGVIWYQGEANGSAGVEYRTLFPRLIADWRRHWNAELPFLFVQLPGWEHDTGPAERHDWPWLREAQLLTAKTVPRTAMAVTIDVGDPGTVHPSNKIDVGLRLALAARKLAYREPIVASGPLYRDFNVEAGAVRVGFSETGSGLTVGQSPWIPTGAQPLPRDRLVGFSIAGKDRRWVDAEAKIDGRSVVVSSAQVPSP